MQRPPSQLTAFFRITASRFSLFRAGIGLMLVRPRHY
jgi:hypothetical protein